jgi:DNA repair protein RadC
MKTAKKYQITCKKTKDEIESVMIKSSDDANKFVRKFYFDDMLIYESVFIVMLNKRLETTGWAKISQGGTSATIIDTKIVAKYAIDSLASHIVICHNHPSGILKPSDHDIQITKKIKEALNVFDIQLLDHIIVTENGYYSFADEGNL